jgi:uncharacterized membrane protein YgdD (TMEM256/DUF423 family)
MGAHGSVHDIVVAQNHMDEWKTASHYHFVHAIVLLVLGLAGGEGACARCAWWSLVLGTICFSGSLYLLALTSMKWLVWITPFGGFLMLTGWLLTAARRWPRE